MRTLIATLSFLLLGNAPLLFGSEWQSGSTMVYISTGEYAKSYHSNDNCYTIKRCKEEGHLKRITLEEAKKMGRKPCKVCYR